LGVVYGDIGTSPLYTMREAFGHAGGLHLSEPAVLGLLSLVFCSLILVVTAKYVVLILRADIRGEGGVLALGTLAVAPCLGRRPSAGLSPASRSSSWHSSMAMA
jgi:KUP system potassium uptake protein